MGGFFRWLTDSTKFVVDGDKDAKRIAPVYGTWRDHPAVGQWFPRDGINGSSGVHYCMGCGALATRTSLTEVPRPEDPKQVCNVLVDRENETRRRLGMPPVG